MGLLFHGVPEDKPRCEGEITDELNTVDHYKSIVKDLKIKLAINRALAKVCLELLAKGGVNEKGNTMVNSPNPYQKPRSKRGDVFDAINVERAYQDRKWGFNYTQGHSAPAWLTFMRHHLQKTEALASTRVDMTAAMDELRKVVALGVSCLELYGVKPRTQQELLDRQPAKE